MATQKTKTKRNSKSARKPSNKAPKQSKTDKKVQTVSPECPYRGTYGILFTEANRDYIGKAELIKKVAEKTGKSEKVIGFAYQVLKSPSHRSNKNRSAEITEGDKVKLIAIRKPT